MAPGAAGVSGAGRRAARRRRDPGLAGRRPAVKRSPVRDASGVAGALLRGGKISSDQAEQAHADLLDLTIEYWPYALLAAGAWQHRHNLTSSDASSVASPSSPARRW
jgi:hypothetical protein